MKTKNPYDQYLNRETDCPCGRVHRFVCEDITVADGAMERVPALIAGGGFRRVMLVQDENTRRAAGRQLESILHGAGHEYDALTFPATGYASGGATGVAGLRADETATDRLAAAVPPGCDLIIAVGSGTINDLCRFVSFQRGIPYIIIATAPSMDGYASDVAVLTRGQAKTTHPARAPLAIIGDLDILAAAPSALIAAGVGDVLGKYVSLADWRLANLVTDEYYCPAVAALTAASVAKVRAAAGRLSEAQAPDGAEARKQSIAALMEALILSGIAMSHAGSSRPASGSEHQLAHFWEMHELRHGGRHFLHGARVGVALLAVLDLYAKIPVHMPHMAAMPQHRFDEAAFARDMEAAYGPAAEAVIALERECRKNSPESVAARLARLAGCWDEARAVIDALPPASEMKALLAALGAPVDAADIDVDGRLLADGIRHAKEPRDRYGLLQMLYDLRGVKDYACPLTDGVKNGTVGDEEAVNI